MNAKDVLRQSYHLASMTTNMLLDDLTDADMLVRVVPGANHLAWQFGHFLAAENRFGNMIEPNSMPELPAGFAEKHTKETADKDNPQDFLTKDEYLRVYAEQRAATLKLLDRVSDEVLDKPCPEGWQQIAPKLGDLFVLGAAHEVMHNSQITPVRRKLGKPVKF